MFTTKLLTGILSYLGVIKVAIKVYVMIFYASTLPKTTQRRFKGLNKKQCTLDTEVDPFTSEYTTFIGNWLLGARKECNVQ